MFAEVSDLRDLENIFETLGRALALRPQACALGAAQLIHRLVQVIGDAETVEHVQRLTGLGRDHLEVGLPHVTAYKTQPLDHLGSEYLEASMQGGLGASLAYPQQTPASGVDLVDDR